MFSFVFFFPFNVACSAFFSFTSIFFLMSSLCIYSPSPFFVFMHPSIHVTKFIYEFGMLSLMSFLFALLGYFCVCI